MEFTTEDQLGVKIAEMLEAHRGKVDIDLHIDARFERLCSVVAGVIDSVKVAELPTEDGGQYLLQHRHEPPATWLMNASHYCTPEGVEAHGGYSLLSVSVRKLGRKECQLRFILQDDTPSVVNYFTRLTYSIWKMFQKAELRDIIAANRPYLGGSFSSTRYQVEEDQALVTSGARPDAGGWTMPEGLSPDDRAWLLICLQAELEHENGMNYTAFCESADLNHSTYDSAKRRLKDAGHDVNEWRGGHKPEWAHQEVSEAIKKKRQSNKDDSGKSRGKLGDDSHSRDPKTRLQWLHD